MKIIISVLLCTSLAIWTCEAFGIDRCLVCLHRNEQCSLCIPACHSGIGSECQKCVTSDVRCLEMCATRCLLSENRHLSSRMGDYLEETRNILEGESTVRLSYGDYRALYRNDVPSTRQGT